MRRMWAVVKHDDGYGVLEVESSMSRKQLKEHIEKRHQLELLITRKQAERMKNLSIYEFAKKYGNRNWGLGVQHAISSIELGGVKMKNGRMKYK